MDEPKRDKKIGTKTGMVIYKAKVKNYWMVRLPNGEQRYGGVSTPKLQSFIYHLGQGKSYEHAAKLAFDK